MPDPATPWHRGLTASPWPRTPMSGALTVWDVGGELNIPRFTDDNIDWQMFQRPSTNPRFDVFLADLYPEAWVYCPYRTLRACIEEEYNWNLYSQEHTFSGVACWIRFGGDNQTHPKFAPGWRVTVTGNIPEGLAFWPLGPEGPSAYNFETIARQRCGVKGLATHEWAMLAGRRICKFLAFMQANPGATNLPPDFYDRIRSPLDGSDTRSRSHWSRRSGWLQIAQESPPAVPAVAPVAPSPVGVAQAEQEGLRRFMESRRPHEVLHVNGQPQTFQGIPLVVQNVRRQQSLSPL